MHEAARVAYLVLEEAGQPPQVVTRRGSHRDDDGHTFASIADLGTTARALRCRDDDDVLGLLHAETPQALQEEPAEIGRVVARAVVELETLASARERPQ